MKRICKRVLALVMAVQLFAAAGPAYAMETGGDQEVSQVQNCTCEIPCTGNPPPDCPVCGRPGAEAEDCAAGFVDTGLPPAVRELQQLIDALPDAGEITAGNAEEVAHLLEDIDQKKLALTDEELEQVDFARYQAAAETLGSTGAMMLAAGTTINTDYQSYGFIFAEGVPIVIKKDANDITNIYDTNGQELFHDISSLSYICGGWYGSPPSDIINPAPSIVIESGQFTGSVYGGNYGGSLHGDTSITVTGGTISNIYGGSFSGTVYGDANVTINGGTVYSVYGGCSSGNQQGNADVTVNNGTADYVYGGCSSGTTLGTTHVEINNSTVNYAVYGGGEGSTSQGVGGNTNVAIENSIIGNVYGGGNGSLVTGTATVTIGEGSKIWGEHTIFPDSPLKGAVYGGGHGGSIKNTHVIFNGGDLAEIYGGGENCAITGETHLQINETPDNAVTIYGGGKGGTIPKAVLDLYHMTDPTDPSLCHYIYGGGRGDTVGESEINIDSTCTLAGQSIFACDSAHSSSVGTAGFRVTADSVDISTMNPNLYGLDGTGVTGKVTASFNGKGTADQPNGCRLVNIGEVFIDGCCFRFSALNSNDPSGYYKLDLDRLEIGPSGKASFTDELQNVAIGELAGSGTVIFNGPSLPTVTVNTVSVSPQAPIKLVRYGATDAVWENTILFDGPGIEVLDDSTFCFVAGDETPHSNPDGTYWTHIPAKTADGKGVHIIKSDPRINTSFELDPPPSFDKASYRYGDTITITAKLLQYKDKAPMANKPVFVWTGPVGQRIIAEAVTGADGSVTIEVPVNDFLWKAFTEEPKANCLVIRYSGDQTYQSAQSIVFLKDSNLVQKFSLEKADLTLEGAVPAPELDAVPADTLPEGNLYTVQVEWEPKSAKFQANKQYTASLRLIPKDGYSMDPSRIASVTYKGKTLTLPDKTETDGSLLFPAVEVFDPIPAYWLSLSHTPKEGGSVTYQIAGGTATLTAKPAQGWRLARWMVDGKETAATETLRLTTPGDRIITAVFEPIPQYTVTLAASPAQGGTVTGGGKFDTGTGVTVQAVPAEGYDFESWTENGVKVSGSAEYAFVLTRDRTLTAVFKQKELVVKPDTRELTEVPEGLKNTAFNTIEKIFEELTKQVRAAIQGVGDQLVIYDVRLVYLADPATDTWVEVTPENFPKEGVDAILDYPEGTNGEDYTFTIQHMISHGKDAGKVEDLGYAPRPTGLLCHFDSLSPVAIGYQKKDAKPSGGGETGGGSGSSDSRRTEEYRFWQTVRDKIEAAKPGSTVKVDARGYDNMSWTVMEALRQSGSVTLSITWSGGKEIVIPAASALNEARFYYPLSYLAEYGFAAVPLPSVNPETGGIGRGAAVPSLPQDPAPAALTVLEPSDPVGSQPGISQRPAASQEPAPAGEPALQDGLAAWLLVSLLLGAGGWYALRRWKARK